MFTGLVQEVGQVLAFAREDNGAHISIGCSHTMGSQLKSGDSIAVDGVCLTAIEPSNKQFSAYISSETLNCTTLGRFESNAKVNLELAATPTTFLGGHIVTGHVDAIAQIIKFEPSGEATEIAINLPKNLLKYSAVKGSMTINGVSLTINQINDQSVVFMLIPHTLEKTNLSNLKAGSHVNLEVDMMARYCERLLQCSTKYHEHN